jgi:hypothetical protein
VTPKECSGYGCGEPGRDEQTRDTDPDIQAGPIRHTDPGPGWLGWVALTLALCGLAVIAVHGC